VGGDDDAGAGVDQTPQGGHGGVDAAGVGDVAVLEGDVQVGADEDVPSLDAVGDEVVDGLHGHGFMSPGDTNGVRTGTYRYGQVRTG
jgi:hypothetical protein